MARSNRPDVRFDRSTPTLRVTSHTGAMPPTVCAGTTRGTRDEAGFTLVELIIVVAVMPLIIGTLALALTSVLSLESNTGSQIRASADGQVVSTLFAKDIQNAGAVTTSPTSGQCGTGTQLLGLKSSDGLTVVSYSIVTTGATSTLERLQCDASLHLTSTSVITSDVSTSTTSAQLCSATASCAANPLPWTNLPLTGYPTVKLAVTEPQSQYSFNLSATPAVWNPSSGGALSGGAPAPAMVTLDTGSPSRRNTCSTTSLSLDNSAKLIVGSGTGSLQIYATCDSAVSAASSSQLSLGGIITADSALKSYSTNPPTETYKAPASADPLATVLTAPLPPAPSGTVTCTPTSPGPTTCPQGTYDSGVNIGTNMNVVFGTAGATNAAYIFDQPVVITSNATVTFNGGDYWFKGGLYINSTVSGEGDGGGGGGGGSSAVVTFGTGTYLMGDANSGIYGENDDSGDGGDGSLPSNTAFNIGPGATATAPSGALFYIQSGTSVLEGKSIAFTGLNTFGANNYDGVSIWDAAASGTDNPFTITSDASTTSSFGGIYVPGGQTVFDSTSNTSTSASATFLVTDTASVTNQVTAKIG